MSIDAFGFGSMLTGQNWQRQLQCADVSISTCVIRTVSSAAAPHDSGWSVPLDWVMVASRRDVRTLARRTIGGGAEGVRPPLKPHESGFRMRGEHPACYVVPDRMEGTIRRQIVRKFRRIHRPAQSAERVDREIG
jgi:hypothetical protein